MMQLSTWSPNDVERQRRTNRRYGAQEMAGPKVQTYICIHDIQYKAIGMLAKVKVSQFLHANCTIVRYLEIDHERSV
jgi:hypothetical protein